MEFGVVEFTKIAAYVIIYAFLWRSIAAWAVQGEDGTTRAEIGKAMGYLI